MTELVSSEQRRKRFQTAYNAARAVRRKIKTLQIRVGETDTYGNLCMRTDGVGRHEIAGRVVRESDWRMIMEVVSEAWHADPESVSGRELVIADSVRKLREHLEKRR